MGGKSVVDSISQLTVPGGPYSKIPVLLLLSSSSSAYKHSYSGSRNGFNSERAAFAFSWPMMSSRETLGILLVFIRASISVLRFASIVFLTGSEMAIRNNVMRT